MNDIAIWQMQDHEVAHWAKMRLLLWPHCPEADNDDDVRAFQTGRSALRIVFLAGSADHPIGFVEISERSVVDGAGNDPQAYVEGWFVTPDFVGLGIGRRLIEAATDWAAQKGYSYLGSDVELHNEISQKAHLALGFKETGRVAKYLKSLA